MAGLPHQYTKYDKEDGLDFWEIFAIEFSGIFLPPSAPPHPTLWSVREINSGDRPWLRSTDHSGNLLEVNAGVTVEEFRRLVALASGETA